MLDYWHLRIHNSFYFYFLMTYLFHVYECPICMYTYTPEEGIGSHYRWLWATMWLLRIELRSSGRTVRALNRWALSPAPIIRFCFWFFLSKFTLCLGGLLSVACFAFFLREGQEGRKKERKKGRKEGRKEERKRERKEEKKEGREVRSARQFMDGYFLSIDNWL